MQERMLKLAIEGMHCGACVRRLTAALERLDRVQVVRVDVGSAELRLPEAASGEEVILDAVARIGFKATAV